MITAADLTAMRATVRASLPDTCDIVRVTETPGAGGTTTTTATIATGVPCRYTEMLTDQDRAEADRLAVAVSAALTLPALTDITATDRVANVTVGGVLFGTYEVVAVMRMSDEKQRRTLIVKVS